MSPPPSSGKALPFHKTFFASAVAACTAEVGPIGMTTRDHELIAAVRDLVLLVVIDRQIHPGFDTASGHCQSAAPSAGLWRQIQVGVKSAAMRMVGLVACPLDLIPNLTLSTGALWAPF